MCYSSVSTLIKGVPDDGCICRNMFYVSDIQHCANIYGLQSVFYFIKAASLTCFGASLSSSGSTKCQFLKPVATEKLLFIRFFSL